MDREQALWIESVLPHPRQFCAIATPQYADTQYNMSDSDALNFALRGEPTLSKRQRRAMITRAHALSPGRILIKVLLIPVVMASITVSVYVRTSPYERQDALRHLAAMTGCDTAASMGLAPALEGQLGYHARNDKNGDGVACGEMMAQAAPWPALGQANTAPPTGGGFVPDMPAALSPELAEPNNQVGIGAKFIKP